MQVVAKLFINNGLSFLNNQKPRIICGIKAIYEWADAADEYSRIEAELLKYNYDDAEHEEIGYLKGKCAGYLAKGVKEGEEKIEIQLEAAERGFDEVAGNLDW